MIHLACILGYGDNLITLSLLERAGHAAANVRVVGTAITRAAAELMECPPPISEEIFTNVAAFYVMKERGITAAIHDVLRFRRWARNQLSPADTLIFEKWDIRTRLLVPRIGPAVIAVPRARNAYIDREAALRPYIGEQYWPTSVRPGTVSRRLLINPSARAASRVLPMAALKVSLDAAADTGTEICLVDLDGRFETLRARVQTYLRSPSLRQAAQALRECDRYLGPDSFFMHLAYYYQIPFLAFFWPHDTYFAPPGMIDQGNYIYFPDAEDPGHLTTKVRALLSPNLS